MKHAFLRVASVHFILNNRNKKAVTDRLKTLEDLHSKSFSISFKIRTSLDYPAVNLQLLRNVIKCFFFSFLNPYFTCVHAHMNPYACLMFINILFIFILHVWVFCVHVCLCTTGGTGVCKDQEKALGPWEHDFQMVVSNYVGAENQAWLLSKNSKCSNHEQCSGSHRFYNFWRCSENTSSYSLKK